MLNFDRILNYILKNKNLLIFLLISSFVGILVYLLVFGFSSINPTNIDFIFSITSDVTPHYVAWALFRESAWNFPFGLFDSISYPDKISIYWADSIPLLAVLFKIFRNILPTDFQYFGIFECANFALQSCFGMLLIRKFSKKTLLGEINCIITGVLFTLSSYILWLSFIHTSCTAHWLILATLAIFMYHNNISSKKLFIYSFFLGFISLGINTYLAIILFLLFAFYFFYTFLLDKKISKKSFAFIFNLIGFIFSSFILGVNYGEFSQIPQDISFFSFNLSSFFNHFSIPTSFLPAWKFSTPVQWSFTTYLGFGIIILFAITLISIFGDFLFKKTNFIKENRKIILFFSLMFIFFLILALSPRISFCEDVLFEYNVPKIIEKYWSMLRQIGRFAFVSYYLLVIGIFIYLFKRFSVHILNIILIFASIFQIIDFIPMFKALNDRVSLNQLAIYKNSDYKFMNNLKQFNVKVIHTQAILSDDAGEGMWLYLNILPIGLWASKNNVKLSDYYLGRSLKNRNEKFIKSISAPKETDIFVFPINLDSNIKKYLPNSNVDYFYLIPKSDIIIASPVEISEIKNFFIPKKDVILLTSEELHNKYYFNN